MNSDFIESVVVELSDTLERTAQRPDGEYAPIGELVMQAGMQLFRLQACGHLYHFVQGQDKLSLAIVKVYGIPWEYWTLTYAQLPHELQKAIDDLDSEIAGAELRLGID